MKLSLILLRLLDPAGERERQEMRRARCVAEANAADLTRTVSMNRDKIAELIKAGRPKINGNHK